MAKKDGLEEVIRKYTSDLSTTDKTTEQIVNIHYDMAGQYARFNEMENAKRCLNKATKCLDESTPSQSTVEESLALAENYLKIGLRFDALNYSCEYAAVEVMRQSLQICTDLCERGISAEQTAVVQTKIIKIISDIEHSLVTLDRIDEAEEVLLRGAAIADDIVDGESHKDLKADAASIYRSLGLLYSTKLSDLVSASTYFLKSIYLRPSPYTYLITAENFSNMGLLDKAKECYSELVTILSKPGANIPHFRAKAHQGLGVVNMKLEQFQDSENHFAKSVHFFMKCYYWAGCSKDQRPRIADVNIKRAINLERMGQRGAAISSYKEALKYADDTNRAYIESSLNRLGKPHQTGKLRKT